MLNRTNLTLSALALSNRLNLGTRSLAANAGVNMGDKIRYIRQPHHGVMRDGMMWPDVNPIPQIGSAFPRTSSSFSREPQCPSADVAVPRSCCVVDVQVLVEPRPDNLADRPERRLSYCDPRSEPITTIKRSRRQLVLLLDSRLRSKLSRTGSLKREALATAPALQLAAARQATNGRK